MKTWFFSVSSLLACDKSAMQWNVKCMLCCMAFMLKLGTAYRDPIPTLSQGYLRALPEGQRCTFCFSRGWSSADAPCESLEAGAVHSTQPA